MILQTLYRALSTKRGRGTYESILSTFMTTSSASYFYLILGTGYNSISPTSEGIESPVYLSRGSHSYGDHSSNSIMTITEAFTNNLGVPITIREVGIKYGSGNENTYCLTREILQTPVTLQAGESKTFTASLKIANNTFGYFNNFYSLLKSGDITDFNGTVRNMHYVSRLSDIVPMGTYGDWGSNDTRVGYGSRRAWWVDVGFANIPTSAADVNLGDGNLMRRKASRTDKFDVSDMAYTSNDDPSYFNIIEVKATFTNNTEETLIIKEKGIFFGSGYYDDYRLYMMSRQVLETPIPVAPGNSVEIACGIKFNDLGL